MKNLNNTVIKVLTPEHGKEVIKWWKQQGVDIGNVVGSAWETDGSKYIYYGLIDGKFHNYSLEQVQAADATIIELPTEPQIIDLSDVVGVEMEVSDNGRDWSKDIIVAKIGAYYISNDATVWCYARPIKQYTMEELIEIVGHKFEII